MTKMKKWIALVGVMAFLISALVPMGAWAAGAPGEPETPEEPPVYEPVTGHTTTVVRDYVSGGNGPFTGNNWGLDHQPVVLVNNRNVRIDLTVSNVPEGAQISWSRIAPEGTQELPTTSATYTASVASGDFTQVGRYFYTCIVTMDGIDAPFEFHVDAVGARLQAVQPEQSYKASEDDEEVPITLTAVVNTETLQNEDGEAVNLGSDSIQSSVSDRNAFQWTNNLLGSDFDVFPYVAGDPDDCGYFYNSDYENGMGAAQLKILRIYNDGVMASQVAAGVNTYTVSSTAMGIDPSPANIRLNMIPTLEPVTDGVSSAMVNGIGQFTFVDEENTSLTTPLRARWVNYIAPRGSVEYVWRLAQEDFTPVPSPDNWSEQTSVRAVNVYLETPSIRNYDFYYTCEPVGAGIAELNLSEADKAGVIARYHLEVQRTATDPTIESISAEYNNGNVIRTGLRFDAEIPEGDDLILKVNAKPGVGAVLEYEWTTENGQGQDVQTISDKDATETDPGYAIEDDGKTLRIIGVNRKLDNYLVRVTVTNRGGKTDSEYVRISLTDPAKPSVQIVSDPEATSNTLEILEGTKYELTANELSGISAGYLLYEWEQTTTVDNKGNPTNWKPIENADAATYTVDAAVPMRNEAPVYYRVKVSNRIAPATYNDYSRNNLIVKVTPTQGAITITDPVAPFERTIEHGQGAWLTFAVEAHTDDGKNNLKYQWYMAQGKSAEGLAVNESNLIEGATESTYSPGALGEVGYYIFKCKVSNADDERQAVWSEEFRITVTQSQNMPVVTVIGDTLLGVVEGGYVRLKVDAYTASGDTLGYEWVRNDGGTWTAVPGETRKSITLSNLQTAQNGTQYKCRVTNLKTNDTNESRTFTVNVWRQEDVPVIITQPRGWTLQSGTSQASAASLSTTIESGNNNAYTFNWQRWDEQSEEWLSPDLDQLDIDSGETASSTLEFNGVVSESGRYRCEIVNQSGTPAGARAYTDPVEVSVMLRHTPNITSGPKSQTATVGKTVTLRVTASIYPKEDLLYSWEVSADNGQTWRACNGYDGSGWDTPTFTTAPMSQSLVGRTPMLYRCVVEGAENRVKANNITAAAITVVTPYPQLSPSSISKLNIEPDSETGERYLTGYRPASGDLALTVRGVREDVTAINLRQGTKYSIEVTDKNGKVLKNDDDIVTTGSVISLILNDVDGTGTSTVADELTMVVDGDVLGVGRMSINQLVALANHMLGERMIPQGAQRRAADLNNNGRVADIGDLALAARMIAG